MQYICASATIDNPKEHVELLCGVPFVSIEESGGPCPEKCLVFMVPPLLLSSHSKSGQNNDGEAPSRKSAFSEAGELIAEMVSCGIRVLCFVYARKLSEIVAASAKEELKHRGKGHLVSEVDSYRAGYSPEERRMLEGKLMRGEIKALVSTSALELGIDVGSLDATIHVGVNPSASSFWQQVNSQLYPILI